MQTAIGWTEIMAPVGNIIIFPLVLSQIILYSLLGNTISFVNRNCYHSLSISFLHVHPTTASGEEKRWVASERSALVAMGLASGTLDSDVRMAARTPCSLSFLTSSIIRDSNGDTTRTALGVRLFDLKNLVANTLAISRRQPHKHITPIKYTLDGTHLLWFEL